MAKKTPLYQAHIAAKAKMVDFHGWEMPIHYGSQIQEHHAVRKNAGMFDVSHMNIVDLEGADCEKFLRYLLANDVAKLKSAGCALYTPLLNHEGGILDDLIVYKRQHGYRLVMNSATYDKDMQWLVQQVAEFDVTIIDRDDLCIIAVQGPLARAKASACLADCDQQILESLKPFQFTECSDILVARTGYTGEDGFEIMLPVTLAVALWQRLLEHDVMPCGLGARDTLRLEAGLNLYGSDMDETQTPLTSNIAWTVAFEPQERDFIGRDALVSQKEDNNYAVLSGLVLTTKGVLRAGLPVYVDGEQVGVTVSGTFSPTLQKGIAFARIKAKVGDLGEVEIRGKRLPVTIVKLPFVKQGKILINLEE